MPDERPASTQAWLIAAAVSGFVLILLVVAAVITLQAITAGRTVTAANEARAAATRAQGEAARAAAEVAEGVRREIEAEAAGAAPSEPGRDAATSAVLASIDDLLRQADADLTVGRRDAARSSLTAALAVLDRVAPMLDPLRRAALRSESGRLLERAGDAPAAIAQFHAALADLRPILSETHPEVRRLREAIDRLKSPPAPGQP